MSVRSEPSTARLSQKQSKLREPDEQYPISPQSPNFVLKTPSQIQILKALLGAINWKLHKFWLLIITT
jgi:hypothetical protein